jgi:hypothetical protein
LIIISIDALFIRAYYSIGPGLQANSKPVLLGEGEVKKYYSFLGFAFKYSPRLYMPLPLPRNVSKVSISKEKLEDRSSIPLVGRKK